MSNFAFETAEVVREAARYWWLYLLTGILWIVLSLLIFRFDITSLSSISYLFGVIAIFFGVNEFFGLGTMTTGWKIVHVLFGILCLIAGVVALIHPYDTFATLAALIGVILVFKGVFDIVIAFATKDDIHIWWLQLVVGIIEVLLGFWASGNFGRSAALLVIWVAAACLARGITEIILAFKLHGLRDDVGGPITPRPA
jgi:uncharacterized membrane protein HdeD (DUF308 family)